jgi:hypothetical protein
MRTIAMMLLVCGAAAGTSARGEEGCSKDIECKGDRICVDRQCIAPPAKPADAQAAPASYQPLTPPTPDPAKPPPPSQIGLVRDSTTHRHLGGYIRPDLGFGYVSASASSSDVSISGAAGSFGIAAGGAVAEDIIVAFHLWDVAATNPTVSVGGTTVNNADATLTVVAFGPQITTYSTDNFYFSITPSLTRATLSSQGTDSSTNWGFGARAAVGKEWWVSDHWGLGLAAQFSLSINQDSGTNPPTWTGWGGTLAFSATYN